MTTAKQRVAARRNVERAQAARRGMSRRAHSRAQPKGRSRRKPGTTGRGAYYHVEVRPKAAFVSFRTQDVGGRGGIERVAGKRGSGSWDTQKWLISKRHAHLEGGRLIADSGGARKVLEALGSSPRHLGGDRFKARPRQNVPEAAKPTAAQKRARQRNIRKAQAARRAR